jgi:hypothetical protein
MRETVELKRLNTRSLQAGLKKKHRLEVFGNRALRRIFGPEREEVTGEWKELRNEELQN